MILPKEKQKPTTNNPKFFVYFGKPKSGKSEAAARLEDNLIIDLEDGYAYIEALVVKASSVEDLAEIANAIREENKRIGGFAYKYITIDNGTKLEEISLSLALKLYNNTPMGKSYVGDVRKLPNGAGYMYMQEAFFKILDMFRALTENLILICHTKDKLINSEGKELSEMSLDLTGKTSRLVAAAADAIAYCYRKKNQTIMNLQKVPLYRNIYRKTLLIAGTS